MRVVITRPLTDAAEFALLLGEIGAEIIYFPTIEIQPATDLALLDQAIAGLEQYDWLIFTSVHAVDIFFARVATLNTAPIPQDLRIAAVGTKTAGRLVLHGHTPDFVPDEFVAEAILPGLGDLAGRRVLLPLADIAHDTLPGGIRDAGGRADVITVYHTIPAVPDRHALAEINHGVDVITFTSGSTVRNFIALLQGAGVDPFHLPGAPHVACIGPKTAREAEQAGLRVSILADPYTVEGLAQAIQAFFKREKTL
jgi:uroporphyrinogen-III synthase